MLSEPWNRLTKSAKQGFVHAQTQLGLCYEMGLGVEKDNEQAVDWLKKAAAQGDPEGQTDLGYHYIKGLGVKKDHKEAVRLFAEAAELGHAKAQTYLGQCYEKGLGVEKDDKRAVHWYAQAAAREHAEAQFNLGSCYENGRGINKNLTIALYWYQCVQLIGDKGEWTENAKKAIKRLTKQGIIVAAKKEDLPFIIIEAKHKLESPTEDKYSSAESTTVPDKILVNTLTTMGVKEAKQIEEKAGLDKGS